ncbi:MAG TPA: Uma2 family endonuclease [Gemmatimonadales bacterium]|nr:Uma2 family endonuclease [Gemmatimonadales bacterium]
MAVPIYHTADMVRALPDDGNRYEVVHGELLVTPAPRGWHQELCGRLYYWLRTYLERHPVGHVFASPADISWGPDVLVQPDAFVTTLEQARTMDWSRVQDLLLVVEVLSPSTSRADRFTKRRLYQEQRIALYWVVDPNQQVVEVWTPDAQFPTVEREAVYWQPSGAPEPFLIRLEDLFRPI